jgi:cytochrome c oxidase cbb3-type subunit III
MIVNHVIRFVLPAALGAALLAGIAVAQQEATPREPDEEYGEWLARPSELAATSSNRIARSLRLNAQAMMLGRKVYADHCAGCHGADLKGLPDQHTPDLTDDDWRFGGDDLPSGGAKKYPSDVEWTVRYGIRSGHPNARGAEVSMLAFDPQYRTKEDTEDFGDGWFINLDEIDDVVEYVMQISGRPAEKAKADRGEILFHDGAKGNCYDCHGEDGAGIDTFGSTNLTRPDLYLYGSDRVSIRESIVKGRHGTMPAFEGVLKPEEIKAVSVYVFSRAATK